MPARFITHTILLILATAGVYLWLGSPFLSPYTLQLVAILVLLYLGTHALRARRPKWFHRSTITIDITILTSMILLLVTETGGLLSPLFFLCYFLLFAVAMLYEIEATLVLTGVFILFFLFLPGTNLSDLSHLSELLALVMITPLAILTGHQYESVLETKKINEQLNKHLGSEESDTLLFLSLNLKRTLLSALDSLSLTIPQAKANDVRTNLQTLYEDLKNLYRSADELQQAIDKETDQT
ncbi:MAG: hypothetical protein ABII21_03765 [bacterium]